MLAPHQPDSSLDAGFSSAAAAASHGFARLAALLRWGTWLQLQRSDRQVATKHVPLCDSKLFTTLQK